MLEQAPSHSPRSFFPHQLYDGPPQPAKSALQRTSIPQSAAMERLNVWNGLDELAFYENTIILELLERSQGISPVSIANSDPRRDSNEDCGEASWVL